jgi:hypothetical protein
MLKADAAKKCETCGIFDWCAVTILVTRSVKRCLHCWLTYYRAR